MASDGKKSRKAEAVSKSGGIVVSSCHAGQQNRPSIAAAMMYLCGARARLPLQRCHWWQVAEGGWAGGSSRGGGGGGSGGGEGGGGEGSIQYPCRSGRGTEPGPDHCYDAATRPVDDDDVDKLSE
jgi:hypothetical protein